MRLIPISQVIVVVTTALVLTALLRTTTVLAVLHLCVVGAGHTLHLFAIAVVAGDDDSRVLQLVLQLRVRSEDDAPRPDERGESEVEERRVPGAERAQRRTRPTLVTYSPLVSP